ncbi:DUF881 domain-containing protein [Nocardioides mesophilus]|uniref:DUF881 domain-containing protein n=1 Tax=Nocardioides mesophilus TaxID=433659 RepID=A0A7G9RFT6_9ACTN|nr:DUF881 domain-containing protein [Nocardioides mesophilus]QNN54461.1 DUF881 domain-containing protein [Nocardioides mesophilus]
MSVPEPGKQQHPAPRRRPHRQGARERIGAAVAARLGSYGRRSLGWRLGAPLVFVLAGALFVTSAVSSGGTDLRAGRYDDLPGLVSAEARQVKQLRLRQEDLSGQVDQLTTALGDTRASAAEAEAAEVAQEAGTQAVHGPGVTVTLTDAPAESLGRVAEDEVNNLVVHEGDIQAVVNALWDGGAEAMTIQGQRIVSTTGIKCVGNAVIVNDVPYAPPYVISAIGPAGDMLTSLNQSPYIGFYLEAVVDYDLGWDVQVEDDITAPEFTGSTELSYARPAGDAGAATSNDDGT